MAHLSHFTALFDANVLYPAPLRDLLMRLAMTGLFRAKWTDEIQEEWARNLLINRPDVTRSQVERIKQLMNDHAQDARVDGYQSLMPALSGLPDPGDRHVLAAAIVGRVHVIVTYNLRDFPIAALTPYGIAAQHPDEFIRHLIDLNEHTVCRAVHQLRSSLRNPPKSAEELLDILSNQELPQTVAALRELVAWL